MDEMPSVPKEAILEGKVLGFTTMYADDSDMQGLFALVTKRYIKKCLICATRKNITTSAVWIPGGNSPTFFDEASGKEMVFGYALCGQHTDEMSAGEGDIATRVEDKVIQIVARMKLNNEAIRKEHEEE
jgi:hypothetical protein